MSIPMNDSTTTSRGAARRAAALTAFGVLLGIASVAVPAGDHRVGNGYGGSAPTVVAILSAVAQLGVVGLGCFVAYRRPQNPIGWLLAVGGCTFELDDLMVSYASFARTHALPGANLTLALEQFMWIASVGLATIFIGLLFPTGRLLPPRWRWVARAAAVGLVLAYVANTLDTDPTVYNAPGSVNPLRPAGTGLAIVDILSGSFLLLPLSAIAAVVALVVRYRRGGGEERHQIRIVMFAASLYALTFATDLVIHLITGHGVTWLEDAALIGIFAIPVGAGIAVLKYGLYDIDIVISRTLVYGSLGVFITAVYVAIVVGIGTLIGSGGRPNLGLSIAATAIVAVAFQPVRERVQRVANRLVYGKRATPYEVLSQFSERVAENGKRATPYEVLSQFSERVAESYASDDVLPRMARVLAEGTNANLAEVWLRSGDVLQRAAVYPPQPSVPAAVHLNGTAELAIPTADRSVVVRHQGEVLGAVTVTKRRGEQITPIEV